MAMAVLFAVAYAVPIVVEDLSRLLLRACQVVEWTVWLAFTVDYGVRLALAEDRWRYVRRHPFTLLAVLVPLLRPLRLLRLVSALVLVGQRARLVSQVRLTTYVAGACAGLLVFGSLAVLEVERDSPDATIHTLGDAVWWAFTTMTTVGYGDTAPTTSMGRVLAVGLMLSGIALLGTVTANIAAWFIARSDQDEADYARHTAAVNELTEEVRQLREHVAELSAAHRSQTLNARTAYGDSGAHEPEG